MSFATRFLSSWLQRQKNRQMLLSDKVSVGLEPRALVTGQWHISGYFTICHHGTDLDKDSWSVDCTCNRNSHSRTFERGAWISTTHCIVHHALFQLTLILQKTPTRSTVQVFVCLLGLADRDQGFIFMIWSDRSRLLDVKPKSIRRSIFCKSFEFHFFKWHKQGNNGYCYELTKIT